jgi:hypothetical protein
MGIKQSEVAEDFGKLFEAACVELPMAAAKRVFGDQDENAVRDAGWKAYDSWVRLANDASNRMYANPTFGTLAGRGIQAGFQVTRVVDAVASAIFGNLWPAIGLPTALELQALRADVKALRDELRTVVAEAGRTSRELEDDASDDEAYAPARGAEAGNESAEIIWNGFRPASKRRAKGGKKSVAL